MCSPSILKEMTACVRVHLWNRISLRPELKLPKAGLKSWGRRLGLKTPEEDRQGRCWSLYWYSLDHVFFQNEGKSLTSGSSLIISICLFIVFYKYGVFQNLYRSLLNIQILRIPTRSIGSKSGLWEPCLGIASHFSLQKGHCYHISFLLLLKQIVTNLVALINTSLLSHSSQLRIKYGSHTVKTKISAWLSSFLECLGDSLFPVHLCCWQNQFLTMIRQSFVFSCWL